jgi:ERCC4-related helicase
MMNFYHEHKNTGMPVPAILGLTASPIISSDLREIEKLENTMDAICVTPTTHREQLLKHVNKPHLVRSLYDVTKIPPRTQLMQQLQSEYSNMDIAKDPEVLKLKALVSNDEKKREKLMNVIMKHDTFSQQQVKGMWNKSREILAELGSWAVDRYISQMIKAFLGRIDAPSTFTDAWSNEDRTYLAGHLRRINIGAVDNSPPTAQTVSHKTSRLIHELLAAGSGVVGIIFVKERATAYTLCELLNNHPLIQDRYRVGAIVGASSYGLQKQKVYEYSSGTGPQVLDDFRSGAINLLVATSVLEEGIDVPACNLVVSFDEIATLKSFIQRRGRARMQESKMIALLSSITDTRAWEDLERGMKDRYEDDQRELARLDEQARAEEIDSTYYIIKNTGARLDLDNARQHLDRFCRVVFRTDYVGQLPDYVFHKEETEYGGPILRATVTLPGSLPLKLRKFQSACGWKSERNAMKDAAFQAYVALYEAGLVTDNLAPLNAKSENVEEKVDLKPDPLFDPWVQIAQRWKSGCDKQFYHFEFTDDEFSDTFIFNVALPALIDLPRNITLYPGNGSKWSIVCDSFDDIPDAVSLEEPDQTSALLAMNFQHRWPVEDREHVIKMSIVNRSIGYDHHVTLDDIGAYPFCEQEEEAKRHRILVRDQNKTPFHYVRTIPSKPDINDVQRPFYQYVAAPANEEYLVLERWGLRADLLHDLKDGQAKSSTKPYECVLPISYARVDRVKRRAVKCGMFIPHIIHELEVQLIASELSSTLLKPVGIENLQLVLEAISSRSACEPVDYERLEFLGDSILKFCTVIQAYSERELTPCCGGLYANRNHRPILARRPS